MDHKALAAATPAGLLALFDRGVADAEGRFGAVSARELEEAVDMSFLYA